MKSVFNPTVITELSSRINKLNPQSKALWGKMTVAQMLAHCNVSYEMAYEEGKHPKPNALMKFILKSLIKSKVTGEDPYKRNNRTAPAFLIKDEKDFNTEKEWLIAYITTTGQLGEDHFEGKESHSFGKLDKTEWSNMFYKHLDHHLTQFGA